MRSIHGRRAAWPSWDEVEREVGDAHDTGLDKAVEQSRVKYIDADQLAKRLTWCAMRGPPPRADRAAAPDADQ
jgi:hypothetical protein